jgi:hypothetical protein
MMERTSPDPGKGAAEAQEVGAPSPLESVPQRLEPGQRVRLNRTVPYLKSADPMPMLRPPDLVDPGESGLVVALRAGRLVAVRFRRGTFLLELDALSVFSEPG